MMTRRQVAAGVLALCGFLAAGQVQAEEAVQAKEATYNITGMT
ncbi:MAG: hypothetical protein AMXMBFR7_02630 [Planctomycetota bacterium]